MGGQLAIIMAAHLAHGIPAAGGRAAGVLAVGIVILIAAFSADGPTGVVAAGVVGIFQIPAKRTVADMLSVIVRIPVTELAVVAVGIVILRVADRAGGHTGVVAAGVVAIYLRTAVRANAGMLLRVKVLPNNVIDIWMRTGLCI